MRQAIYDAMRFWLDRGVDGFRVDALDLLIKGEGFPDNPPNSNFAADGDSGPDDALLPEHTRDQPEVHQIVAEMRRIVDEYDDRILLGELYLPLEKIVTYYGDADPQLHLPLNMRFAWIDWETEQVGEMISEYRRLLPQGAWPAWTLSNHDRTRLAGRLIGEQTRVAAMLMMTLQGTPTLYYGEEIGMKGVPISPENARDPQGRRTGRNRDPERTPMQWEDSPGAGFTSGNPWLPIGDDVATANVAAQRTQSDSLLTLYRELIALRQNDPALLEGTFELVSSEPPQISYRVTFQEGQLLIVLNLGPDEQSYHLPHPARAQILLSTFLDRTEEEIQGVLTLRGNEGVILRL